MTTDRRNFLRLLAGGTALVTTPAFLAGCGVMPAVNPAAELPRNPFLDWFDIDERRCSALMSALTANGADWADIYFQQRRRVVIAMEAGTLAEPQVEVIHGVGMRVLRNGQAGFAFTEDFTSESLLATARTAAGNTAPDTTGPKTSLGISEPGQLYVTERHWSDVNMLERMAIVESVNNLARAADPRIDSASIRYSDSDERIMIVTMDGRIETDRRPMTRLSVQLNAARNDLTVSGFANTAARDGIAWYTPERRQELVNSAVARTLLQFDARQPPLGNMPVVLAAGNSGIMLHEVIGHALEADFARDGHSPFAGQIGDTVASPNVTIIDQADIPHARGALNIDDEGTAGQRNVLIENGVLRGFLHDHRSALNSGAALTGSARRESYRYEPMPRMTCTWMADGRYDADEIVASVDQGLLAETYTKGQVLNDQGDFSFVVKNGWLIKKGQRSVPVRDVILLGNGPALLQQVEMVGNDGRFDSGGWTCGKRGQRIPVSQGMPTTRHPGLTIALAN